MFTPRTVFVVGAGASCDLELPTGDELRFQLMEILRRDGDRFINAQMQTAIERKAASAGGRNVAAVLKEYSSAAGRLREGLPVAGSIDALLDTHRNDEPVVEIGKLAIATVILGKEHESVLGRQKFPEHDDHVQMADLNAQWTKSSWYFPLMRLITTARTLEDLPDLFSNVAFIVFNYDRCLEHFLKNAIRAYFNVTAEVAGQTMRNLQIVHPYGQLGWLSWQEAPSNEMSNGFGVLNENLFSVSQCIRTFTESRDEGIVSRAKEMVRSAHTLVFLGFGFVPQNVEMLTDDKGSTVQRVFATALGIGDTDIPILMGRIGAMIQRRHLAEDTHVEWERYQPFVETVKCRALFERHWLRLTASE